MKKVNLFSLIYAIYCYIEVVSYIYNYNYMLDRFELGIKLCYFLNGITKSVCGEFFYPLRLFISRWAMKERAKTKNEFSIERKTKISNQEVCRLRALSVHGAFVCAGDAR